MQVIGENSFIHPAAQLETKTADNGNWAFLLLNLLYSVFWKRFTGKAKLARWTKSFICNGKILQVTHP